MVKFDKIGMFLGKEISKMTHDELLEFAAWASKEIDRLQIMESNTQDFRIKKEITTH